MQIGEEIEEIGQVITDNFHQIFSDYQFVEIKRDRTLKPLKMVSRKINLNFLNSLKKSESPKSKLAGAALESAKTQLLKLLEKDDKSNHFRFSENKTSGIREIPEKQKLSPEEKLNIKKDTGWSDKIIDSIGSMKEYDIYKNANLKKAEINGEKHLVRNDINWNKKDAGSTNEYFGRSDQRRTQRQRQ